MAPVLEKAPSLLHPPAPLSLQTAHERQRGSARGKEGGAEKPKKKKKKEGTGFHRWKVEGKAKKAGSEFKKRRRKKKSICRSGDRAVFPEQLVPKTHGSPPTLLPRPLLRGGLGRKKGEQTKKHVLEKHRISVCGEKKKQFKSEFTPKKKFLKIESSCFLKKTLSRTAARTVQSRATCCTAAKKRSCRQE